MNARQLITIFAIGIYSYAGAHVLLSRSHERTAKALIIRASTRDQRPLQLQRKPSILCRIATGCIVGATLTAAAFISSVAWNPDFARNVLNPYLEQYQ